MVAVAALSVESERSQDIVYYINFFFISSYYMLRECGVTNIRFT